MAKDQSSTGTVTNRKIENVAAQCSSSPTAGPPIIAVDIANSGADFTRALIATTLDGAETTAKALAQTSGKPTRITINGNQYQVYSRGNG